MNPLETINVDQNRAFEKNKYVMISYNHTNKMIADNFYKLLEDNGLTVWMAPYSISFGSNYMNDIASAVQNAAALIFLVSGNSQRSEWCQREIQGAIEFKIPIIPVYIEDCPLVSPLNFYLSSKQCISSIGFNDLMKESETAIKQLIPRLKTLCDQAPDDVVFDDINILTDVTTFLKDTDKLFDALISIIVKNGLCGINVGTYEISKEIQIVEDYLFSNSAQTMSLIYGGDPITVKILLYSILSKESRKDVNHAAKFALQAIDQLKQGFANDNEKRPVINSVIELFERKKKSDLLFSSFYDRLSTTETKRDDITRRKMEFLAEHITTDPRIDVFMAIYNDDKQLLKKAIDKLAKRGISPHDFTDRDIFRDYESLLKDFG